MIRILLVDDHEVVLMGIKSLLQDVKGFEVVGVTNSSRDAVLLAKKLEPDVVIMDVQMPGIGGFEATRKMKQHNPDIKILVLTVYKEEPYPTRLIQAGASGYMTKTGFSLDELIRAIKAIHAGQHFISPEIAQQIAIKRTTKDDKSPMDLLSERELQIMLMIVQGQKVQDIAKKLCLSPKTVNSYRYRIFEKLGVKSDVALALLAMRLGMIDGSMITTAE